MPLTNVWTRDSNGEWVRTTAMTTDKRYSYSVSADSRHFRCYSCFQYVTFVKGNSTRISHFKHSAGYSDIRNLLAQFRSYAHFLEKETGNTNLLQQLSTIDPVWEFAKYKSPKYLTDESFKHTYNSINNSKIQNPEYLQALFLSLWEGIYSKDFSAQFMLTSEDIQDSFVTVKPLTQESYSIEVSEQLVSLLRKIAGFQSWSRNHRTGTIEIPIYGKQYNSCFKVEDRNRKNRISTPDSTFINVFRRWLRDVISPIVGFNITAFDVYVSGIMTRIAAQLHQCNISVVDAFAKKKRDSSVKQIIESELRRCGYKRDVKDFKVLVEGYLGIFDGDFVSSSTNSIVIPDAKRIEDESLEDIISRLRIDSIDFESLEIDHGKPLPKAEIVTVGSRSVYPRNRAIAAYALKRANFACEISSEHTTFISRARNVPYTEPHHLIPLAYADSFACSLDVVENIVSLCSNCHNLLHYGKNASDLLYLLYLQRKEQLEKAGIDISFDELLAMYIPPTKY